MLIGLNGRMQAGKDTTFEIIKAMYPDAEKVSFAAKLKQSAAAALGISVEELERLKLGGWISMFGQDGWPVRRAISGREYLQWYGTEAHRDVFGQDFWVDMALPKDMTHDNRLVVVTDMRFPNEVARVKYLGGLAVKVEREVQSGYALHPSEQNLDDKMDYFIDNSGTVDDLRDRVSDLFRALPELMGKALADREFARSIG